MKNILLKVSCFIDKIFIGVGKIFREESNKRSKSDKKERKNKMILNSINDFIDIPIEMNPTLTYNNVNNSYLTTVANPRAGSKNRKRQLNFTLKNERHFHSSNFSRIKKHKSKAGTATKLSRARNFSAVNKALKTSTSIISAHPMENIPLMGNTNKNNFSYAL